jgi:hypothetical protein
MSQLHRFVNSRPLRCRLQYHASGFVGLGIHFTRSSGASQWYHMSSSSLSLYDIRLTVTYYCDSDTCPGGTYLIRDGLQCLPCMIISLDTPSFAIDFGCVRCWHHRLGPDGIGCSSGALFTSSDYYLAQQANGVVNVLLCLPGRCIACNNFNSSDASPGECCASGRRQSKNLLCAHCQENWVEVGDSCVRMYPGFDQCPTLLVAQVQRRICDGLG